MLVTGSLFIIRAWKGGMLYEIPQILGVGGGDLHGHDVLHRVQAQITEGETYL